MALPIDLSRPVRTRAEQVALVEAVRDAPGSEQETNALEWKGSLDLSAKKDLTKIVKAVVGFANRQPDEAAKAFNGCAYLLVGVEPGALAGVKLVDAAKLESGLTPYIGPLIQWRPDYVEVDGKAVLVVAIEPPQAEDPIHAVRKSFSDEQRELLRDGDVFVRHHASTDPAKHTDYEALSRRAASSAAEELSVSLGMLNETPLMRLDLRQGSLDQVVDEHRELSLRSLSGPHGPVRMTFASALKGGEPRSEVEYRKEVDNYAEKLTEKLPVVLSARYIMRDIGLLKLGIVNGTDHTFAAVRMELLIPEALFVCVWKQDAESKQVSKLPVAPSLYGKYNPSREAAGMLHTIESSLARNPRPLWLPKMDKLNGQKRVTFADKDVRAESTAELPPIWVIANHNTPESIPIDWEATAHDASKRLSGHIDVPVTAGYVSTALLMTSPGKDEDR
jgi:hypothetical protein